MKKQSILAIVAMLATGLHAADITWNGSAGDNLWSNPDNWERASVPGDGDRAKFTTDATVLVESAISVGGIIIADGKSPLFQGGGSLTIVNGSVTGGKGARFAVPVIFPEGVNANASSANQYGSTIVFDGGLSGGTSVTSGGNVNYGLKLTNAAVTVPAVTVNCSSFLQTSFLVQTLTLTDTWADGNGNSPNIKFLPGATVGNQTEVVTGIGVPTVYFTNEGETNAVYFSIPALRIGAGGRPTLSCEFHSRTNLVTVGSFVREPGSLVRISNNKKSGTFTPGENAGFIIPDMPADAQNLCPPWAYDDSFRLRKLANNSFAPLTQNDYTAVGGELSLDNPTGLYRLNQAENVLTADSEIDSLLFVQGNNSTTQKLDLAEHDLVVNSGSIASRDWASKALVSSGGGRLVFASDALVLNLTFEVPYLELSAPIAWQKPAGSETQYPDFLIPTYGGAEFVISGEDQVGDWGGFFAEGRGKGLQAFTFDGPSDRTFHGTVGGRFILRKRGTGTLTFAGPDRTRGRDIRVEEGMVVIAHNDAPTINLVTNGAIVRVSENVNWTKTAIVRNGGILEGFGTLTSTHNHNQLFDGCILRGGTSTTPGTLSFGGQVVFPTNIVLDVGFKGDTHGQISVAGKQTFRSNLDTVIKVRVSDADGTANIKRSEVYTVYSWSGSTENYNASRVSVELENATPRRLDTTQAVVTLNTTAKTITITGLRPRRGTIISLQ